jgi:hypothetical protein
MVDFLYNVEAIQNYYNDGTTAMATFQMSDTESLASNLNTAVIASRITITNAAYGRGRYTVHYTAVTQANKKVPQEFLDQLPSDGEMPAPAGACPAAANPKVNFKTVGGDTVTPDLFTEKDIQTIPSELVTMAQNDPTSLTSMVENLVPLGDQRLATPAGWNELLWAPLRAMQQPAESLMDYQLWNASEEIMQEISAKYRERLVSYGVPPIVLNAYDASAAGNNWYASTEPTEQDALAQMDIQAELTGSMNGMVHEQRDFSIPGAAQTPIYGPQTGDGTVTWDAPGVGEVAFAVNIYLDQFDEQGRAIGGTATGDAIDYAGYQVVFTFKPDGSKDGVVLKDGVELGYLTMTVDHEKFENYIDIKSGTEMKIPDDIKPKG